ncbi:uncharacterized protein LOC108158199 isoform X2 [Drosophila miranda]|uniref:uncharacterized protein LOC108158199 isoform X2 n=1 Tax=Drosophila miranda TaxID=7229 RepID=UPI00143F15F9|nr:uncharacterized protein LOC108158199 isoform X2 [Drosophila miranda]
MGCNTSQELKTKDGAAIDAVSNGEPEPSAPQMENEGLQSSAKSSNKHTNHAKSNSITSNGDAKAPNVGAGGGGASSEATNCIERPFDKAAITELDDDEDEEPELEIHIPHHHHHHGSQKFRRNFR